MYNKYLLWLALVKPLDKEKPLSARTELIDKMIKAYNEKGMLSAKNQKHIGVGEDGEDEYIVNDTSIIVSLYSQNPLNAPGKALRFLSQLLLQEDLEDNLSDLVYGDKLFRTFDVAKVVSEESGDIEVINSNEIDDAEFLKGLIDYMFKSKSVYSPEQKKQELALNKMKILAVESGIVSI